MIRVARAARERWGVPAGARLRLEKNLPVSSGLGGGSSDAAAALRLLARLWELPADDRDLAEFGARFGADVPACVAGLPALVSGKGEVVDVQPALPACGLVLANPGAAVPTAAAFSARAGAWSVPVAWTPPSDLDEMVTRLAGLRNDLLRAAATLAPGIPEALESLGRLPGCLLARMSGSGASCFGIFRDFSAASDAAAELRRNRPSWWVAATSFRDARPPVVDG